MKLKKPRLILGAPLILALASMGWAELLPKERATWEQEILREMVEGYPTVRETGNPRITFAAMGSQESNWMQDCLFSDASSLCYDMKSGLLQGGRLKDAPRCDCTVTLEGRANGCT